MSILRTRSYSAGGFSRRTATPCAVVSDRMELVYLNELARALPRSGSDAAASRSCRPNDLCAFNCPTVAAVHDAHEILCCEEVLKTPAGSPRKLGVAVIPLLGMSGDEARAVLPMRPKENPLRKRLK